MVHTYRMHIRWPRSMQRFGIDCKIINSKFSGCIWNATIFLVEIWMPNKVLLRYTAATVSVHKHSFLHWSFFLHLCISQFFITTLFAFYLHLCSVCNWFALSVCFVLVFNHCSWPYVCCPIVVGIGILIYLACSCLLVSLMLSIICGIH